MINYFKILIFRAYLSYARWAPIQRGKYRLALLINAIVGRACVTHLGAKFRVGIVSMLDKRIVAGEYQDPIVLDVMNEILFPGAGFIDIGANIGYFTIIAAVSHQANVYSFEPSPRELASLYENLAANRCSTVIVFPFALGAAAGLASLNIAAADNPGMNSFCNLNAIRSYAGSIPVQIERLGMFITPERLKTIRLCKIDVEGYEMEVLEGLSDYMTLLVNTTFVVEVTPAYLARQNRTPVDIYQFFEKYHFQARGQIRDLAQWDEVFSPVSTQILSPENS